MSKPTPDSQESASARRHLSVELDELAWGALLEEAQAMGLSVEELGSFAVLYYLADRDSGRIARRIPAQSVLEGRSRTAGPDLRVR